MPFTQVVGAVVGGLLSSGDSKKADKNQDEAIALQREQYNDWKDVFGPIRENLGEYYGGLDPEKYASKQISDLNDQWAATEVDIARTRAQQGIDSPATSLLNENQAFNLAESKAGIRAGAEGEVARQKQSFLTGANVSNPHANTLANTLSGEADRYRTQAANTSKKVGGIVTELLDGFK